MPARPPPVRICPDCQELSEVQFEAQVVSWMLAPRLQVVLRKETRLALSITVTARPPDECVPAISEDSSTFDQLAGLVQPLAQVA
jgi:hypothetical protein